MTGAAPHRRQRRGDQGEPLPIALPTTSALPGPIAPEVAVPCAGPFDHPGYRFSVDWDGARTLLFTAPEGIQLQSAALHDLSDRFPELVDAAAALAQRRAVLDGVVTILDPGGCPDLVALGERQAAGPARRGRVSPVFLATDVLHLDGTPTLRLPLDRRLELLRGLQLPDTRIQVPDWVAGEGIALADAAAARGLAGLLARRGDAAYTAGVAGEHRLRIALSERLDLAVVAADTIPRRRRQRLTLAEHIAGSPVAVATVEVAPTSALWRWAAPGGALRPDLVATVAHHGRHRDGWLRDAELVALRDDLDPRWCIRREAVAPPRSQPLGHRGFRPTVLTALPLGD